MSKSLVCRTLAVLGWFCLVADLVAADKVARPRFQSPTECFNAANAAMDAGDFQKYLQCKTAAANDGQTGTLVLQLAIGVALRQAPDEAREILEKHGINEIDARELVLVHGRPEPRPHKLRLLGSCIEDKAAFMTALVEQLDRKIKLPAKPEEITLGKLVVEGNVASAEVLLRGRSVGDVAFRKVDGSWLMALAKQEPHVPKPYTKQQHSAIETLAKSGFLFRYLERDGWPLKRFRAQPPVKFRDGDLEPIQHLTTLLEVYLNDSEVTDKGVKYLEPLKMLEFLDLSETQITDSALPTVSKKSAERQIVAAMVF